MMNRMRIAACLVATLLVPHAVSGAEGPGRRVVAAGGAITEIAYALGAADRLVGVDATSLFPAEALATKPNVGYFRALSAEGILALKPDLVLAVEGAGPPDVLRLVAEAAIPIRKVSNDHSEAGVAARIREIGAALDERERAERLVRQVEANFTRLAAERGAVAAPARVMFVLSMQNGRVMVGGRNTAADAVIRLAGGVNAAGAVEGYKPISDEGIVAARPDIVVTMQQGDLAITPEALFGHPAFALVPAARQRALVTMDGLYLLAFGPRTPDAARDLMSAIARFSMPGKRAAAGTERR